MRFQENPTETRLFRQSTSISSSVIQSYLTTSHFIWFWNKNNSIYSSIAVYLYTLSCISSLKILTELHPRSPRQFAWKPSGRISQTLQSSYLSHLIAATTQANEYWHLNRSDCRNTLIYAHTASRTLPTCDISLGSLKLPAPESGNFLELILLYSSQTRRRPLPRMPKICMHNISWRKTSCYYQSWKHLHCSLAHCVPLEMLHFYHSLCSSSTAVLKYPYRQQCLATS
jgi:hypothetical protein